MEILRKIHCSIEEFSFNWIIFVNWLLFYLCNSLVYRHFSKFSSLFIDNFYHPPPFSSSSPSSLDQKKIKAEAINWDELVKIVRSARTSWFSSSSFSSSYRLLFSCTKNPLHTHTHTIKHAFSHSHTHTYYSLFDTHTHTHTDRHRIAHNLKYFNIFPSPFLLFSALSSSRHFCFVDENKGSLVDVAVAVVLVVICSYTCLLSPENGQFSA